MARTTTTTAAIAIPSQKELLREPAWNCVHRSDKHKGTSDPLMRVNVARDNRCGFLRKDAYESSKALYIYAGCICNELSLSLTAGKARRV
ncbi:hypothetical protein PUN28_000175 [Cardiocondyla obscurior]|uniref:Uncharacterized protein n=1 Tax=Cardiocondyla obscurior TaxID=286306 RepID=A0AAW2GYK3_9HYME